MAGVVRTFRVLDLDYPRTLRELPSPPDPIWVEGELLAGPAIAIVGTRAPSPEAADYARNLGGWLAQAGVSVWSGGALGIDAAAHLGALEAGGVSVAVVGTGLDHCYPPQHAGLYRRIVETGGALVSAFEPDQHATLTTFPQRNALLAAMTQITVVVQAPIKSGARSTAKWARRLHRPLYVVPGAPWDELSGGNCAELGLGARPLVNREQLLEHLHAYWRFSSVQPSPPPARQKPSPPEPRAQPGGFQAGPMDEVTEPPAARAAVIRAAHETPRHLDDFCSATGFPAGLVQEALLTLTLEAVLVEGPVGWFRTTNPSEYLYFGLRGIEGPIVGPKKG
jgi:DNA processing protein